MALALTKACTQVFQPEGQRYLQQWLSYEGERWSQHHYRGLFRATGLLGPGPDAVSSRVEEASAHVSPSIYSEALQAVGTGLDADRSGYDGILLIGPFNCLALHISEAILKPVSIRRGMPLLTYESDGCAVSPAFLRQVDVHIQAILDRASTRATPRRSSAEPVRRASNPLEKVGRRPHLRIAPDIGVRDQPHIVVRDVVGDGHQIRVPTRDEAGEHGDAGAGAGGCK